MEMVSGSWCGASAERSLFTGDGRGYTRLLKQVMCMRTTGPASRVAAGEQQDDRQRLREGF
jgi:hypothetical protein